jgi:hypothetical protein
MIQLFLSPGRPPLAGGGYLLRTNKKSGFVSEKYTSLQEFFGY